MKLRSMSSTLLLASLFSITTSASAKTTISWWQFWTDPTVKPVILEMVSEFEKSNPDIKVDVTDLTWSNGHEKIVIAFGSGTGPDIVELGSDWIAEFAANDLLYDISGAVSIDSSDYQGWSMAEYNKKLHAFPWILGTRVLFANKELLQRAGYAADFVPVNLPQLKEAAFKVDALGKEIYGWGSNTPEKHRLYKKFLPFFWSMGGQLFSDDGRFCVLASDWGLNAMRMYKELHDSCGFVADQRGIEDAFLSGKVGFIISGDWLLKRIEVEQRKIDFATSLFPGQKFPGWSFLGGEFLAVNKASKSPEAALKLIRFLCSPENQVKFCKANRSANPSSKTAQENAYFKQNSHLQTFIKQINLAKHPPVDPDWVYIEETIESAVEEALFGSGLVAQPMMQAARKIEKLKKPE